MEDKQLFIFCLYWIQQKLTRDEKVLDSFLAAWKGGLRPGHRGWGEEHLQLEELSQRSLDFWKQGGDEISRWQARGIQFLLPGETHFPNALMSLSDPPRVLSVIGDVSSLSRPSLAVVGTREPCGGSLAWMQEHLSVLLECVPLNIVSGGARGVDQMAHRMALQSARATIAFLPSGVSCLYPRDLQDWILPICEAGGALVSEYHPRTTMKKWHFSQRNRLIAGLAQWTLIVEGKKKSGTWLTAQQALQNDRALACVAGAPWMAGFSGNLQLISDGATMIRDAQDLLMFLGLNAAANKAQGAQVVESAPNPH